LLKFLILFTLLFSGNCKSKLQEANSNSIDPAADHGVVSSANSLASQAGIDILKNGGNAFDAAIAVGATLNVVEPTMSGMGGYGTILIYDTKEKKLRFLDSSGKIPLKTNSDLMRPPTENYLQNRKGAKSVSTPGTVNAWYALSSEYGILKWEDLFQHAIRLAEDGFNINSDLARNISYAWRSFSDYSKEIYGKDGNPLSESDVLIQEDLAKSFQQLAEHGTMIYYQGQIAEAIDLAMKEADGFLSIEDLKADKAEWWEPIGINYRGYEVYTASPPSTAFPSLIRLGLMSHFDNSNSGHNSAEYLHRFAEVTKHAFWCRLRYAGDPEIKPPPLDMLLSEDYWERITGEIDSDKASTFIPPFDSEGNESKNTTHFVVADKWGNIVCATQTLGNAFGSRIMPEGTGFWLNNSLAYCTYEPKGNPMDAIPGQRKLSGDCPTIILKDGHPWVALGTPGGHTIGQTVPQMVMNLIDFKMNIQDALSAPRISFIEPNELAIERTINQEVVGKLTELGHLIFQTGGLGNAHGLMIIRNDNGEITGFKGAADPRGSGVAIEY
jgi:gamma-glutamyltranspeptidase/glutathione hydrolase